MAAKSPKPSLSDEVQFTKTSELQETKGGVTIHGFRSAFSTWAREQTSFPREIVEASLAHTVGDAVERAYARTDFFDKRRQLLDAWAALCG